MNLCLKFEVYVCVYVDKIMNKNRLDQLCWIGEGIVGGCQGCQCRVNILLCVMVHWIENNIMSFMSGLVM